ncbi:DUF1802 family protein [Oscillatoria sp. CS-180]|uniref:DUF1802 family protein n=1 Tax=Oscillatoria sp. CS-180 TaxID=3021720 RepID=UPI0023314767|nr:DUF1802 family protein [Oscillatoria sp. CS-180]MDB9528910.1 DUF1802 family protein [Oscillatoria sp. CS-180]
MSRQWALKEWAIAIDALLSGDLILLIRKGGIRESRPVFEVPSDRALLFPTYEHQAIAAIRPPFQAGFTARSVPATGEEIPLQGWAEMTHQVPLQGDGIVQSLHPFHIWTDAWLTERLAWKPERPAYGLLLRVHRFTHPFGMAYQKRYGGCRSWIVWDDLDSLPESEPVLSEADYEERVAQIQQAIAAPVSS